MTPTLRSLRYLAPHGFAELAYAEWGPREGEAVLCAHGLTRNGRDFDPLAMALAGEGRRVVAVDFPGRGRSAWLAPPSRYGYPLYLAALAALIARLDVERLDWIGTSMGGLAGMMVAAQPGSPIGALVLNDVGPFIPKAALERIAGYVGASPRFVSIAEVEAHLRRVAAPFGKLSDEQWRHLARHGALADGDGYRLHYDPAIAAAFVEAPLVDIDLWAVWERVRCPVLVLRGAESDLLLPATAREMTVRGAAPTRVVEIAGCGHAPALMAEDQIATVAAFLRRP